MEKSPSNFKLVSEWTKTWGNMSDQALCETPVLVIAKLVRGAPFMTRIIQGRTGFRNRYDEWMDRHVRCENPVK